MAASLLDKGKERRPVAGGRWPEELKALKNFGSAFVFTGNWQLVTGNRFALHLTLAPVTFWWPGADYEKIRKPGYIEV